MTVYKKTLCEKEKILVTSIFFFSLNVFNPPKSNFNFSVIFILPSGNAVILDQSKNLSFGKRLNPFPNKPWFLRVCSTSILKTLWGKDELLFTSNFSFSHSVFYPFGELSFIFIKFIIFVCKLFQFGRF